MKFDDLFSANERQAVLSGKDSVLRRVVYMKSIDDVLFEATMEAEFGKSVRRGEPRK